MGPIVSNILSLTQHLITLKENPKIYHFEYCPHCGKIGLWRHGFRYRKADRENNDQTSSLNPIPICRLYCPACKRTCSVLPECIPPFRWYLWLVQQTAIQLFFSGMSFNKISQLISPSRWTISRWLKRLENRFEEHALHLKTKWSWLGYSESLHGFWSALLKRIDLSCAMLFLNNQKIFVP
jgi:transposase-like protein